MANLSSWLHPIHARGIRSPNFAVRGDKLLTDKRIHEYAKTGRYGEEAQASALAKDKSKKKKPRLTLKQVLALLGGGKV